MEKITFYIVYILLCGGLWFGLLVLMAFGFGKVYKWAFFILFFGVFPAIFSPTKNTVHKIFNKQNKP